MRIDTTKLSLSKLIFGLLVCLGTSALVADEKTEEKKITFDDHIKPIFREHCTACHSEGDKASDLALDTYSATLAGGSSGEVIAEGNSGGSRLFALVIHSERPFMPPDQDPIPKDQIELLKTWIEQGMPENSGSKIKRSNSAAAAMLGNVSQGKPDGPPPMPETVLRQPVLETPRSSAISAMAASPWSPLFAVGGQKQVSLYHAESGKLLGVLPFPEGEPQSLTFTRDGKQLLIAGGEHSKSGCAVLVDIATGKRITKVGDELDTVLAADISPDKRRIAIAGPQKIIRIFDSVTGEVIVEMKKHTDWIFSLRYSPDGILLASGDRSNGLIVWEADSGRLYSQLNGHKGSIRALDFRADSNVLASASLDGTVKLWDMFESREIKSWGAHGGGVTAINFANDGLIATSGKDSLVKLWDGNGALQKQYKGLSEAGLEVAITGDGKHLAGGDWNGKVQLWSATDPEKSMLVAANPPSIEKRLAQANETLATVQAEFSKLDQAASTALKNTQAAKSKLANAKSTAQNTTQQLSKAQSDQQQLSQRLGGLNGKIQELERQLAAAKTERQSVAQGLAAAENLLNQLNTKTKQEQESIQNLEGQLTKLIDTSNKAAASRDAVSQELLAAKQAAEEAAKDQAKIIAQREQLKSQAEQTAAQVSQLLTQVKGAEEARESKLSQANQVTTELKKLQDQLAVLQEQIQQITTAQAEAKKELEAKEGMADKLKQQLEAAQQAALDASEQLELFKSSYQSIQ